MAASPASRLWASGNALAAALKHPRWRSAATAPPSRGCASGPRHWSWTRCSSRAPSLAVGSRVFSLKKGSEGPERGLHSTTTGLGSRSDFTVQALAHSPSLTATGRSAEPPPPLGPGPGQQLAGGLGVQFGGWRLPAEGLSGGSLSRPQTWATHALAKGTLEVAGERLDEGGDARLHEAEEEGSRRGDGEPITEAPAVALVALGCPKNTVDAEVMLGDLRRQGYRVTNDPEDADVVIVNTCAFIEEAKLESLDAIAEAAQLKQRRAKAVFVTGCLAQRYAQELATELPDVDAVIGFQSYSDIGSQISQVLGSPTPPPQAVLVGSPTVPFRPESERVRLTDSHSAYLRVAEGCDHACTFCSIPSFRGKFRSKPFNTILSEAKLLVASGVRELNLIAEDTNQWGMDFGPADGRRLSDLLVTLADIPKLRWIRLLYCYPSYFTDELIEAIASIDKVCKYIDIPLQHLSDPVLRAMQRPGRTRTERLLQRLRNRIPGLVLRTTFISGFPGETKDDHLALMSDVKSHGFERGGVFAYSEEEGTPAAGMANQVPRGVRDKRRMELEDLFVDRQMQWAEGQVGQVVDVMIDRMSGQTAVGRTRFDAPEIDNEVLVPGCLIPFTPGAVIRCKVVGTEFTNLLGEPVESG